jgi:conjugative transfer region protein TrbK
MNRALKMAGAAALTGMMMTASAVLILHDEQHAPIQPAIATPVRTNPLSVELHRCRTLTMPDPGCEAAWEEKRRRFFGQERP